MTLSENLSTTSGLSILMHGVILLPGITSYDKSIFVYTFLLRVFPLFNLFYGLLYIYICTLTNCSLEHHDALLRFLTPIVHISLYFYLYFILVMSHVIANGV